MDSIDQSSQSRPPPVISTYSTLNPRSQSDLGIPRQGTLAQAMYYQPAYRHSDPMFLVRGSRGVYVPRFRGPSDIMASSITVFIASGVFILGHASRTRLHRHHLHCLRQWRSYCMCHELSAVSPAAIAWFVRGFPSVAQRTHESITTCIIAVGGRIVLVPKPT